MTFLYPAFDTEDLDQFMRQLDEALSELTKRDDDWIMTHPEEFYRKFGVATKNFLLISEPPANAKEFGVGILKFPWCDNISEQFGYSLQLHRVGCWMKIIISKAKGYNFVYHIVYGRGGNCSYEVLPDREYVVKELLRIILTFFGEE